MGCITYSSASMRLTSGKLSECVPTGLLNTHQATASYPKPTRIWFHRYEMSKGMTFLLLAIISTLWLCNCSLLVLVIVMIGFQNENPFHLENKKTKQNSANNNN